MKDIRSSFIITGREFLLHPTDIFYGVESKLGLFGPSTTGESLFMSSEDIQQRSKCVDMGSVMLTGFATDRRIANSVRSVLVRRDLGHAGAADCLGELLEQLVEQNAAASQPTWGYEVPLQHVALSGVLRDSRFDSSGEMLASVPTVLSERHIDAMQALSIKSR